MRVKLVNFRHLETSNNNARYCIKFMMYNHEKLNGFECLTFHKLKNKYISPYIYNIIYNNVHVIIFTTTLSLSYSLSLSLNLLYIPTFNIIYNVFN